MRFATIGILVLTLALAGAISGEELSSDTQREIIEDYLNIRAVRAGTPMALSASDITEGPPPKCGTPAVLRFIRNYDKLDRSLLEAAGAQMADRPQLAYYHDTPGGQVRIHYDLTGDNTVWQAGVDSDGDGAPDYIEAVGLIADSVYSHLIDSLGYPIPIADTACVDGGDERLDIYIVALQPGYYGVAYNQQICSTDPTMRQSPSWIEIDHDFQHLPEYVERPLDAARVTLAHEMFHAIHFAIDATEDIVWFEMTATWMEEEQYDDLNDYYYIDEYFFDFPTRSLQSIQDVHHYASVFFPIYLTELYGPDIIKSIWLRSALLGPGVDFLQGCDQMVDSASGGSDNLNSAFAEFALWNFFTGPYAHQAPAGVGYQERANYAFIPLEKMDVHREYPVRVLRDSNHFSPQINAATYLRLENLPAASGNDTLVSAFISFRPDARIKWGISAIFQLESDLDSHLVMTDTLSDWLGGKLMGDLFGPIVPELYRSVTFVVSATSIAPGVYLPSDTVSMLIELFDTTSVDQSLVNIPASVLSPYPNPAVISQMNGADLKFKFQAPTDNSTYPTFETALLLVDIYSIAGERLITLTGDFSGEDRTGIYRYGIYEVAWDMTNQNGHAVASGAYLAYARLYESAAKKILLAEDKVKVAIIK